MRRPLRSTLVFLASLLLLGPSMAMAQDDEVLPDARLMGYEQTVALDGDASLTWILLIGLMIFGLAALFMNPKRSHLD